MYRRVTPNTLSFCIADTTPAVKRSDDMGAWIPMGSFCNCFMLFSFLPGWEKNIERLIILQYSFLWPAFAKGASAVSDQDNLYLYLWLFLSWNSEKQYYSQPKSCSIASYWQQKRYWSGAPLHFILAATLE